MHKNTPVAIFNYKRVLLVLNKWFMPIGTNGDIYEWFASQSMPANRERLKITLKSRGINLPIEKLFLKNYGLNLNNQYWFYELRLGKINKTKWRDINYFNNSFNSGIGKLSFLLIEEYNLNKCSFNSPDNSTRGKISKRWIMENGKRILVKRSGVLYRSVENKEHLVNIIGSAVKNVYQIILI